MTIPLEEPEIPAADRMMAMMEQAAEEAIAHYRTAEHAEEKKLAKLMTTLDLCVFIPATVMVIVVIVWLKLSVGPEVGTLTMPTGYAIVRACISRRV